jgi:hypothetical protein
VDEPRPHPGLNGRKLFAAQKKRFARPLASDNLSIIIPRDQHSKGEKTDARKF